MSSLPMLALGVHFSSGGDLSYNASTGEFSFTERTDSEVNGLADTRIALQVGTNLDLSNQDTGDLAEGTNLYYTNARADGRIALQVGANLDLSSKDTGDLAEGSNLYYTQPVLMLVSVLLLLLQHRVLWQIPLHNQVIWQL